MVPWLMFRGKGAPPPHAALVSARSAHRRARPGAQPGALAGRPVGRLQPLGGRRHRHLPAGGRRRPAGEPHLRLARRQRPAGLLGRRDAHRVPLVARRRRAVRHGPHRRAGAAGHRHRPYAGVVAARHAPRLQLGADDRAAVHLRRRLDDLDGRDRQRQADAAHRSRRDAAGVVAATAGASPSGASIRATQHRDIWTVPAGGGPPVRVTDDPATDATPAWSRRRPLSLFLEQPRRHDQPVARGDRQETGATRGPIEPVTVPTENAVHPTLSRDGNSSPTRRRRGPATSMRSRSTRPRALVTGPPRWVLRRAAALVHAARLAGRRAPGGGARQRAAAI